MHRLGVLLVLDAVLAAPRLLDLLGAVVAQARPLAAQVQRRARLRLEAPLVDPLLANQDGDPVPLETALRVEAVRLGNLRDVDPDLLPGPPGSSRVLSGPLGSSPGGRFGPSVSQRGPGSRRRGPCGRRRASTTAPTRRSPAAPVCARDGRVGAASRAGAAAAAVRRRRCGGSGSESRVCG